MESLSAPHTAFSRLSMPPLTIGGLEIRTPLILAPMSGVTNSAFRRLIHRLNPGCVGLLVSEFISVEGLTRGNPQSTRMMAYRPEERPISIQIFGHEISRMADAARIVEESGADIVDINCGCPVPKVVKKGGGCELMRQPEHLEQILVAVKKAVTIPVTMKMRAGWDTRNRNAVEIARIAEGSGVDMIAVHGRTRQEMYRGSADWSVVSDVTQAVRIPVVGSGDIVDAESLTRATGSGASGVMIGRGALANPWVFSDIATELAGGSRPWRSPHEVLSMLKTYSDILLEDLSEKAALGRLKQVSSQSTRLIRGSAGLRRELCCSSTLAELLGRLETWLERTAGGYLFSESESVDERDESSIVQCSNG